MRAPSAGTPPYPFETVRNWYVSPFGGWSEEIGEGQVGLRSEAVAVNLGMDVAQERVGVAVLGEGRGARPLFYQDRFEVVPLDESRPQARELSPNGEVVLPAAEWDVVRRPQLQPRVGQSLVIERAPARLATDPAAMAEIIVGELRRRRG